MRVLQLIDSLNAGGAERIAVNYANSLAARIEGSYIAATRGEGQLKAVIKPDVGYLFLDRKKTLDLKAALRLKKYIVSNQIDIIHAHGPSFFIAVMVKLIYPKIKIIWHEHYGARVKQTRSGNLVLYFCAYFFNAAFVVNRQLESWVKKKLPVRNVYCIPNFVPENLVLLQNTILNGTPEKRIVLVANLKEPKNHIAALRAFYNLDLQAKGWSLHFIGEDYGDQYADNLKAFIEKYKLQSVVYLYGPKQDIPFILSQAAIGLLVSTSEGFPLVILEYGMAGLGVISTNAGFCAEIIEDQKTGLLFDPSIPETLENALGVMTLNHGFRESSGIQLSKKIKDIYTEDKVIGLLLSKYQALNYGN